MIDSRVHSCSVVDPRCSAVVSRVDRRRGRRQRRRWLHRCSRVWMMIMVALEPTEPMMSSDHDLCVAPLSHHLATTAATGLGRSITRMGWIASRIAGLRARAASAWRCTSTRWRTNAGRCVAAARWLRILARRPDHGSRITHRVHGADEIVEDDGGGGNEDGA